MLEVTIEPNSLVFARAERVRSAVEQCDCFCRSAV